MGVIEIRKSNINIFEQAMNDHKAALDESIKNNTGDAFINKFLYDYWYDVVHAHENGKKLIGIGAGLSPELILAFDAVPLWFDLCAIRFATMPQCGEFIDLAEQHIPSTFCTIDRAMLGGVLSGTFTKPDAMLRPTGPCDSFRQSYGLCVDSFEIPDFVVDQPILINDRGVRYVADQYKEALKYLEKVTGNKFSEDKLREIVHRSNQAAALIIELAEMRKAVPCPLPGLFMALNEYNTGTYGTQGLVDLLVEEYKIGKANLEAGVGVTKGKEKHRVLLLQNMIWNMGEVLTWMEQELDTVLVSGTFEGVYSNIIDETSLDTMLYGLAARGFQMPMTHLAGAYAKDWREDAVKEAKDFNCDCAMFLGHVGCKHTWAASKMISDALMKNCGIKTLELDVDSVDNRYQKTEDVEASIKDFIETVG